MARLVAAFGSSHSVMLGCELDDWLTKFNDADRVLPFYDRQGRPLSFEEVLAEAPAHANQHVTPEAITRRFREMEACLEEMKRRLQAARLDVLVILGDDQHELFRDELMPGIGLYYGATIRNAVRTELPREQWYRRAQMRRLEETGERHYPCHPGLALHLIGGLRDREFDVAAVAGLGPAQYEGHAYSFVHRWYLQGVELPIVPVFLNTYYDPNQPLPRRCVKLGAAIRAAIADYPQDLRVGVRGDELDAHARVVVLGLVAHEDVPTGREVERDARRGAGRDVGGLSDAARFDDAGRVGRTVREASGIGIRPKEHDLVRGRADVRDVERHLAGGHVPVPRRDLHLAEDHRVVDGRHRLRGDRGM